MSWKLRSLFLEAQEKLETSKVEEAEKLYSEILVTHPQLFEALLHRAYCRLRLNRLDLAEMDAKRSAEMRPDNGIPFVLLGQIYLEMKNPHAAYESLKKAISLEKDNGFAYYHLARTCKMLGLKLEAAEFYSSALQFERDYTLAHWMADAS